MDSWPVAFLAPTLSICLQVSLYCPRSWETVKPRPPAVELEEQIFSWTWYCLLLSGENQETSHIPQFVVHMLFTTCIRKTGCISRYTNYGNFTVACTCTCVCVCSCPSALVPEPPRQLISSCITLTICL